MFKSIITAVDGSEPSQKALEAACNLAKTYGAELHLVHSPQLETTTIAVGFSSVEVPVTPEGIAEAGKAIMEDASGKAAALGAAPTSTTIGTGDATEDILQAAKLNDADLIVMGRRGLGSLASLFMGSVSQKVSHGAECSVLTVHH